MVAGSREIRYLSRFRSWQPTACWFVSFFHLPFLCLFLTYVVTKPKINPIFVSHFPHCSSNDSVCGINIILPIN